MLENDFFLWFGMIFPLVFSAGPANITVASLAAHFGFYKALPFILGVNLTVLAQALLVGFGADTLLNSYPLLFQYLKYVGSAYLIYLAFKFFRWSCPEVKALPNNVPNFFDGFILQLFNMKVITVIMLMFSQFLDTENRQLTQVVMLSVGLAWLTIGANLTWAGGGAWLARKFASEKSAKLQGYIFGGMLICVSIWILL